MKRLNVLKWKIFVLGSLLLLGALHSCKHEPIGPDGQDPNNPNSNPAPGSTAASTDGAVLYSNYCSGCHGTLAASTKRGSSVATIQNGIATISNMKSLNWLSAAQIQAIADVLKVSSSPSPTPSADGATLYANYCASCHGPLAASAKLGATAAKIQNGINTVSNMKSLSSLTSAQIQAIADALKTSSPAPLPSPTDGAALYSAYCAGCHGPLASSAKLGATVSRIQSGISSVADMKSLSSLTTTQIQAIAKVLTSTPMPTDGASLYAINCASCHGALATSQVGGSSVSKIQGAIKEKPQMNYLSTLTLTQLQAIAGALANVKGGDD